MSEEPSQVTTVLGSCVSVTFFDTVSKSGSIFHALLPIKAHYSKKTAERNEPPWRYVDSAIEAAYEDFKSIGARPGNLQIKVFGGAGVLIPEERCLDSESMGMQNVKAAFDTIQKLGLRVTSSDVGGKRGRKIIFFTHTGEVLLKRLHNEDVADTRRHNRTGGGRG